ncbi:hypothetical protein RSOLAG22IIIB_07469 [Rhizoctonia solani]|uniref:Chitin-binding type-4 domain-containing protein n=1 Tax=Rhizoctonia solani TaxID=456999 RepID=A0A0K6FMY7_9AGAM|nr:hypothetical protein RSOLAG22IIIB_07469 [Rhizoctonia solani]
MRFFASLLTLATLASSVVAHGIVTQPPTRTLGSAMIAACGAGAVSAQQSNVKGPIESQIAKIDSNYKPAQCNLFLCRGQQFADNTGKVQTYKPGQVVNIVLDIENHHPVGYANVSVIDTATNKIVGSPLIAWDPYFTGYPYPKDQENFNVTIPELNGKCKTGGECVLQYHWYSRTDKQTYQNCVDFVV